MAYTLEGEWANGFFNNQIIWVQETYLQPMLFAFLHSLFQPAG